VCVYLFMFYFYLLRLFEFIFYVATGKGNIFGQSQTKNALKAPSKNTLVSLSLKVSYR